MTLTEDKFSTSTQQMIYTISNKSSNIFSKWKEERGKGKEAREERREGREERKEKGREEKKVFEVDAASLWQWAKIPCLPGPGFLLVKCRQWCFLIGLLGSSCLANIIHWHYPHWYHLEMWANFRLWGPRMITNWSGPMGLYPAVFHSLQWTQCPLGLCWGQAVGGPPAADSNSGVMNLPSSLDRGWKYQGQSFLGPFPPITTTVGPPLSPP